jgi:hypothetical protein
MRSAFGSIVHPLVVLDIRELYPQRLYDLTENLGFQWTGTAHRRRSEFETLPVADAHKPDLALLHDVEPG